MYPILVDLSQLQILVIGGGRIAHRKITGLIDAGGQPTVLSPELTPQLQELATAGKLTWLQAGYTPGATRGFQMVFCCTDDPSVNQQVAAEITPEQLFNDTTQQDRSSFFNMAYVHDETIGLAATTFGRSPKQAKALKGKLQEWLRELQTKKNDEQ